MARKKVISIITKGGDKGQSSLANGQRLAKDSQFFNVVGSLDELNSWLGLVVAKLDSSSKLHKKYLLKVQDTLFYIGAEVAQSPKARLKKTDLTQLEKKATKLQESLEKDWHTKFVLPGGTELGAWLDITRSVCRRCERELVTLSKQQDLNPVLHQYLNRLSDYLYLLRCHYNAKGKYSEKKFIAKF